MNQKDFLLETDRLKESFSEKYYSRERLKILWEAVKDYPAGYLRKVITNLIIQEVHTPKIVQVISECRRIARPNAEPMYKENPDCLRCRDAGTMIAVSPDKLNYSFRCYCKAGEKPSQLIPRWNTEWEEKGYSI